MVRIAEFQPVTKSDVPDIPDWAEKVLVVLNGKLLEHTLALQKRLTLPDNFNGETRELELRHGIAVDVKLSSTKGKPRKVSVVKTDPSYYSAIRWESPDVATVKLSVVFSRDGTFSDDPPTGNVAVTIDIEGSS